MVGNGVPVIPAIHQASDAVIGQQLVTVAIPKRFSVPMRQIWELQWRLALRNGKRADKTLGHEKFRAGYDFLLMREAAGERLNGLGNWWTRYQDASPEQQQEMLTALPPIPNKSKRRKAR